MQRMQYGIDLCIYLHVISTHLLIACLLNYLHSTWNHVHSFLLQIFVFVILLLRCVSVSVESDLYIGFKKKKKRLFAFSRCISVWGSFVCVSTERVWCPILSAAVTQVQNPFLRFFFFHWIRFSLVFNLIFSILFFQYLLASDWQLRKEKQIRLKVVFGSLTDFIQIDSVVCSQCQECNPRSWIRNATEREREREMHGNFNTFTVSFRFGYLSYV